MKKKKKKKGRRKRRREGMVLVVRGSFLMKAGRPAAVEKRLRRVTILISFASCIFILSTHPSRREDAG
ncbi:hypothetical protein EYF80_065655 [Liparis tanakae]|uniref:Uncharacterized protein n=1 Tax=Liparis tanakae TaxID=230148 RepID=A0A4Z2E7C6_9TELE|nr:hypothetical protein EYF80_065655 [Liparis tanakae]